MPELAASQWFFLVAITLGAGIIQSATGFGFAVIAVPLFLLTLDSLTVIQINIVLNLVNALVVVPRIWRQAPVGLLPAHRRAQPKRKPLAVLSPVLCSVYLSVWRHFSMSA